MDIDVHQQPTFFDPQGRVVVEVPLQHTSGDLGFPAIHRMNQPLAITPATNTPLFDGRPVNYDWVIEDLCRKDGMN